MLKIETTLKKYGYLHFTPKTDNWSQYKLSDGTIVEIKAMPLKFLKPEISPTRSASPINTIVIVKTFSPPELRGTASTTPPPADIEQLKEILDEERVKVEEEYEPWDEYELDGNVTVSIKTIMTSASRTKLFDAAGEPVYFVAHQVVTKRDPPIS